MATFKQFIMEEGNLEFPQLCLTFGAAVISKIYEKYQNGNNIEKQLHIDLSKKLNRNVVECDVSGSEITLYVTIENSSQGTEEAINTLIMQINKVISDMVGHEQFGYDKIVKLTTPVPEGITISNRAVYIAFQQSYSLKNIHKHVDCAYLHIYDISKVTSNVLSILKIKNLEKMESFHSNTSADWYRIVKKYIKDKDILACQEELMEAGLNQYAKL